MNPEITKIIEQYLSGELSADDTKAFEERLSQNKELQEELNFQKSIHEAAKRSALRTEVQSVAKNYHFLKKLKWGSFGLGILIVAATSTIYLSSTKSTKESKQEFKLEAVNELTEKLEKQGPIDNLKSEFFAWNANDTAFLSKEGVLVSVPTNAFLLNGKPYQAPAILQWQEALDGAAIVKAGLSTTSDGKLLETQGMFSFSAKTPEGKQLTINPKVGVYVQVPVDEYKEGMKLFDGEKDSSGMVNWIKPRELDKIPIPVSMNKLDFYPTEYEPKLNELKATKDKKYRDSLYLSFEENHTKPKVEEKVKNETVAVSMPIFDIPQRKITVEEMYLIYEKVVPINYSMSFEEAFIICNENKFVSQDLINFPVEFFLNDDYGRLILYSKAMKSELLEKYLRKNGYAIDRWNPELNKSKSKDSKASAAMDSLASESIGYIPPSSVLAFWKPNFNNSILATREFEARMKEIHKTCDKSLLDLYVKNIKKPLYEIDQRAVEKGYSQFKGFANQRVGSLNANSPHLNGLQDFYKKAIQHLKQQEKTLREKENDKRISWDGEVNGERQKEKVRTAKREAEVFNEEYTLNHKNVRKQLGRVLGARIYGNNPICNIDRFVMQTTIARKTGEFYDQVTGKTARIQYNEFSFTVSDNTKYKQLYAYLFPHELNSYHRINGKNGKFSFPLNESILYDLAIIGITEDGYSYVERLTLKGGELGELQLNSVSEKKLDASIHSLNKKRGVLVFSVKEELRWLVKEQKNYVEQKRRSDDAKFRNEIRPKVFPCAFISGELADTTGYF